MHEDTPERLHTEADDVPPLEADEAAAMGEQAVRQLRNIPESRQTVYGEVDEGYDNEDQVDAHHAEKGEHL